MELMGKGWERAEGGGGKYTLWALFAMVRLEILRLCSIENSERIPRNLDYIHLASDRLIEAMRRRLDLQWQEAVAATEKHETL